MGHAGFGYAFLLVFFMDSGCSLRDFDTDTIQINFLLCMVRITDALENLGVIYNPKQVISKGCSTHYEQNAGKRVWKWY